MAAKASPKKRVVAPAVSGVAAVQYVAGKPLQLNGRKIKAGDPVPEASSWLRVESWVRSGHLKVLG